MNMDTATSRIALSRSLLIICAHGSAYHPAANEHVLHIADGLGKSGDFAAVQTVFQAGHSPAWSVPSLSQDTFDQILIVPYMMSDGFLAKQMINKTKHAIQEAGLSQPVIGTGSVGTHPAIADITLTVALAAAEARQISADQLSLVIVAHGSRNAPQSRLAAEAHVQSLQNTSDFKQTILAFIEEPPFVMDVLQSIHGPAIVVGLFAAPGGHAIVDIAEAIEKANRDDLIDAGPIGMHQDMHNLITARAIQAIST